MPNNTNEGSHGGGTRGVCVDEVRVGQLLDSCEDSFRSFLRIPGDRMGLFPQLSEDPWARIGFVSQLSEDPRSS